MRLLWAAPFPGILPRQRIAHARLHVVAQPVAPPHVLHAVIGGHEEYGKAAIHFCSAETDAEGNVDACDPMQFLRFVEDGDGAKVDMCRAE